MIGKALETITDTDIKGLVENNVLERKTLEYKSEPPESNDAAKKEFLADVSSFANTMGGDLIIGLSEKNGVIQKTLGTEIQNPDQEISRLESMVRDGISPRISIEMRSFDVDDGKRIIILRIPASQYGPHRVIFKGSDKFFRRNSNGKYPMDVLELRSAFQSTNVAERVRDFRANRIQEIRNLETPKPISNYTSFLAVHIVPLSAMSGGFRVPGKILKQLDEGAHNDVFIPFSRGGGWSHQINMEGIAVYAPYSGSDVVGAYTQLYSDGKIEVIEENLVHPRQNEDDQKILAATYVEAHTLEYCQKMLDLLKRLEFQPPFYFLLSLTGVKDCTVSSNARGHFLRPQKIRHNDLLLPEVIVENWDDALHTKFRPVFDMVWNAAGISESPNYDADGNFTVRTR